jgi:hypothetical protein
MSKVQSFKRAQEEANAKGLQLLWPDDQQLFVDIDDEFSLQLFERGMKAILAFWPDTKVTRKTPSPSGKPGRYHIVIELNRKAPLTSEERLTLQALLGSDPKREILGHVQLAEDEVRVTRFFEKFPEPSKSKRRR